MKEKEMATNRETQGLIEAVIIIEELANDRQKFQEAMRRIQSIIEDGVKNKGNTEAAKPNGEAQGT